MPTVNAKRGTSKRPSPAESEAYATSAYQAHNRANLRWEDRQAEYYKAFKEWAIPRKKVLISEAVDVTISDRFIKIRALEASDPKLAEQERIVLYRELTQLWIDATSTLTDRMKSDAKIRVLTVSTFEGARELEGNLLTAHIYSNPHVDQSVPGADHYGHLARVVIQKNANYDYHTNPEIWWTVHDILYQSWLKEVGRPDEPPPPPTSPWSTHTGIGTKRDETATKRPPKKSAGKKKKGVDGQ